MNKEVGYCIQINKEVEFMSHTWIKETNLANFFVGTVPLGKQSLGYKHPGRQSYGRHFPPILPIATHGLEGKVCYSPLILTPEVESFGIFSWV